MYRPETTQNDSEPRPSPWGVLTSLGIIILLGLVGFVSVLVIGAYLPYTGAKAYWFGCVQNERSVI